MHPPAHSADMRHDDDDDYDDDDDDYDDDDDTDDDAMRMMMSVMISVMDMHAVETCLFHECSRTVPDPCGTVHGTSGSGWG